MFWSPETVLDCTNRIGLFQPLPVDCSISITTKTGKGKKVNIMRVPQSLFVMEDARLHNDWNNFAAQSYVPFSFNFLPF